MSADEPKSFRLRSKLALHVNLDAACADVAFYLRIELAPGPGRTYQLLSLPVAARLIELDTYVEPISFDDRVHPSNELAIRGARALRIGLDMEHAAQGAQPRAEQNQSAILLHAPHLPPYPEDPHMMRKFLVIMRGAFPYARTPPRDVHVLYLPRPYSLNNRILVTASDAVLDAHQQYGPPAMDLDPPILATKRHTRRIQDAGADDTTTYRGSEYGADEIEGVYFAGGFPGGQHPITIRWGPAADELTYMDVEKAYPSLSLTPQGDVGHPTYFAFVCTVRLTDLHLPWITEGGVVSVDILFAHAAERVVRFDKDGVKINPSCARDQTHPRSAGGAPLPTVRAMASFPSLPASSSMDDSDLLHVAPPANLDAMDGSVISPPPWVPPPDEGDDGCDILLDSHRVFDPHTTATIILRGIMSLLPHRASPSSRAGSGQGLVSFTAPVVRVRRARTTSDLTLHLEGPLLADPEQSRERGSPVFVWQGQPDTALSPRQRMNPPRPLSLPHETDSPVKLGQNGFDADVSNCPSLAPTTKPEKEAKLGIEHEHEPEPDPPSKEIWLPTGKIELLQGRSGTFLGRLLLPSAEEVKVTFPPQVRQLRTLSHQPLTRPLSGEISYPPSGLEWTSPPLDTVPLPTLSVGVGKLTILYERAFTLQPKEVVSLAYPGGEEIHSLPPSTPLVLIPASKQRVGWKGSLIIVAALALTILFGRVIHLQANIGELEHQVQLLTMAANLDISDGSWSPEPVVQPPPSPTRTHEPVVSHEPVVDTPAPSVALQPPVLKEEHPVLPAEELPDKQDHDQEDWLDAFLPAGQEAESAAELAPLQGTTGVGFLRHAVFRLLSSPLRLALASLAMLLDRLAPPVT